MDPQAPTPDAKTQARRRLVRGAFAAPALLTLHSGSSAAYASAINCVVKRNLTPVTEPVSTTDGPSDIFRYRLWALRKQNGDPLSYWIKGADLAAYVRLSQTPFLNNTQWQAFNITTNVLVGSPQSFAPPLTGDAKSLVQDGPWVSLRVSSTGAISGAGGSGGGSALSDSCWNSFALGSPP